MTSLAFNGVIESARKLLKRIELSAGGRAEFATKVSLAVHTTRKPRPGRHVTEVLVNGEPIPLGEFEVRA